MALPLLGLCISACRRPAAESASVSIQIPSAQEFKKLSKASHSVYSLSQVDFSLLCFAVNVKGPAVPLTSATSQCDIERGLFAGSVASGQTLTLDVPDGSNYSFELYGIIRNSTTEACPLNLTTTWGSPVDKVYFLGKTEGVTISPPTAEVVVNVSLPERTQNLIAQNSLPASCSSAPVLAPTFGRVQTAAAVMSGTTFKVYARASDKDDLKTLQGTQFKIQNWKADLQ
jgi:hypothetical protein